MGAITQTQAALFAAVVMLLLAGFYLADNAALLREAPVLFLLGSVVPSVVWSGFFFLIYRRPSGRAFAWMTFVFAVLLEALVAYVRFQQSVNYWTPFGNVANLPGGLLRLGWAVFLVAFSLNENHRRTRHAALVLAILCAPSVLVTAYALFNSAIGFLLGDIPTQAFWRALIAPGVRALYWLSQILFLWKVWEAPARL